MQTIRKEARAMDSEWALEIMRKAPYITVSMTDAFNTSIARSLARTSVVHITLSEPPTGKRKQYDKQGEEMKYGRME